MFFIDPLYLIMLAPALALSLWASYRVKSTFQRFNRVPARSAVTGAEAARRLLSIAGVPLEVDEHPGELSDHYDPRVRRLRLSSAVYNGRSLGAIGVAAHEVGHALQHANQYSFLIWRQALAPAVGFASSASWIVIFGGFILSSLGLLKVGIALFSLVVLFQVITLPVELNASVRAKRMVLDAGIIAPDESPGVAKVLNAAAMTYVAGAVSSIVTLLYYMIRAGLVGGSDD